MASNSRSIWIGTVVLLVSVAVPAAARGPLDETQGVLPASGAEAAPWACGTYRGNEQVAALAQHHRLQDRLRSAPPLVAGDFVNDEVWVVEDDGTLLFSGLNAFDTDNATFRFTPNAAGSFDLSVAAFSYDGVLGSNLSLGDDTNTTVGMSFGFPFFGSSFATVHVNANGAVAFGGDLNPSGFFSPDDFFGPLPKIAALLIDLNPSAGGGVFHKAQATQSTFTWSGVPEFGTASINTVQLVLRSSGSFDITFNGVASTIPSGGGPSAVGFHPGGVPDSLATISFSDDLPLSGPANTGIYENYLDITNPLVNEVALFQRFYRTFPDEFFQLVFFTNFAQTMSGFANERNIENGVQGIGLPIFDSSPLYGSNGVLESRCNMNQLVAWPGSPFTRFTGSGNNFLTIMGQEAGHRWGAFVNFQDSTASPSNLILGRADSHWSYFFNVNHSSLEGGNWFPASGDTFSVPTQIDYFGQIDEYLFGLRTPQEVAPTFYVSSPTNDLPQNRDDGTPPQGALAVGTPVSVTIGDIIAAEGPRVPAEGSEQKDLRQGFILIHKNGTTPTAFELAKIATFRKEWEDYFEAAVDGRLAVNTELTTNYPVAVIRGFIRDANSLALLDDTHAGSVERGFDQVIPSGRYTFRYMANATSGPSESITVIASAIGYEPDTLVTSIAYGAVLDQDFFLNPIVTTVDDGPRVTGPGPILGSIYPNPLDRASTIEYVLDRREHVHLSVYDVRGRRVRDLVDRTMPAGEYVIAWTGRDNRGLQVPSGVYFVKLETDAGTRSRKLVVAEK